MNRSDRTEELVRKLASVMRQGRENADITRLPSESQEEARRLYEEAIELVEEITGEKWEFTWLTWF